jgi:hypothetical protein
VRIQTGVCVLSVLDPLRVAEDYATIDQLSRGRVKLVIGKGNELRQLPMSGVASGEQWDQLAEKYELLRRLWREENVTWEGKFRGRSFFNRPGNHTPGNEMTFTDIDDAIARGPVLVGSPQQITGKICSAVKHRPADVVPQPLVVKYELANRLWELVALPLAFESPCGLALALALRRGSTCGLDRVGGRTELVRGDVWDGPGLASSVRGMSCCPTQVSGRAHCMAARRASLGHLDLATHPGAGMLDRLTRPWIFRLSRLEEVRYVGMMGSSDESCTSFVLFQRGRGGGSRLRYGVLYLMKDSF